MNDIEVAFCNYRGQVDSVIEQLERLSRFEIAEDRRRAIASALLTTVDDELAGANERWTPSYDAMLRDVLANRGMIEAQLPPWDEYGYCYRSIEVVDGLRARFETYERMLDMFDRTGAQLLSEAWEACDDDELVLPLLELSRNPDDTRELVRDALIAQLRVTQFGDAYIAGIATAARRDATLVELFGAARALAFGRFRARLGNPFSPAITPSCEIVRAQLESRLLS